MNERMIVKEKTSPEDSHFDRQNRMAWWSQDKVSSAKIMVVGAGALGNETLKNLALLGVRNIFIIDFDTISKSNLSRTVLFKKEDMGKQKAEVAAYRVKEMCLAEDVRVDWLHGDIVWDLGTGIYREMDLVLGCLDNIETRFHVNRQCYLTQTPWIDAGINELALSVTPFIPPQAPCYQCGAAEYQLAAARKRYSCDNFKKKVVSEGKVATVQVASAIASALQTQEAMKLICALKVESGKKLKFQGACNFFDTAKFRVDANCTAHTLNYPHVVDSSLNINYTVKEALDFLSTSFFDGQDVSIELAGDRDYIQSLACRGCGVDINFYKPSFRILDTDTYCELCMDNNTLSTEDMQQPALKVIVQSFDNTLPDKILNQTLAEIGIPLLHIIAVKNKETDEYSYIQLNGDKDQLIPSISNYQ